MQISGLFLRFGRDSVYLFVIVGLSYCCWTTQKQLQFWNDWATQDLKDATIMTEFTGEVAFSMLQKNLSVYDNEINTRYLKRLQALQKLVDSSYLSQLNQIQNEFIGNGKYTKIRCPKSEWAKLEIETRHFADSLSAMADHDSLITKQIESYLLNQSIWLQAQNAAPLEANLFIQSLIFRAKMLKRLVLGDLMKRMTGFDSIEVLGPIEPFIQANNAPMVGENYQAYIRLAHLLQDAPNLKIMVDGKKLIGGRFLETCTQAGRKEHSIEFKIRNPVTGAVEHQGKSKFEYWVAPARR